MSARSARRQAEAALAQLEARRDALTELDREHVGLAPGAQALLKARLDGGGVLGARSPTSSGPAVVTPSSPSGCSGNGCMPSSCVMRQ